MKFKVVIILLLFCNMAISQNKETNFDQISVAKLKKDLVILKESLETNHAGLYTYTSKSKMDSFFFNLEKEFTTPLTKVDFYRRMLPLNELIKNGHTLIIPPESWSQYVATNNVHIPFDIFTDDGKIFILRNFTDNNKITEGDEIISIDGMEAKEILERLIKSSNKDGYNETYPLKMINQDFSEYFANVIAAKANFNIKIKQKGKVIEYNIESKSINEIRTIAKSKYQFEKLPWYGGTENPPLKYENFDKTALLTLPTFGIYNIEDNGIDYKEFFKNTFTDINEKGIESLIIDLRGNGGGHADVGLELFSYLHNEPFKLFNDIHTITREIPKEDYFTGSTIWQRLQIKLALKKVNETKFIPRTWAAKRNKLTLSVKEPSVPIYNGKVYVLIDGWVFSASAMFSGLVKNYDRGIFIGEETGGNPKIQIGDFEQMLTLPSSGLRIRIPLFYEEMDVDFSNPNRGVVPDIYKSNDINQVISKEDSVLKWVLSKSKNDLEE